MRGSGIWWEACNAGRVAPAILSPVCFSGLEPSGDKIAGATLC